MKIGLNKAVLIERANQELKLHQCYQAGMQIVDARSEREWERK